MGKYSRSRRRSNRRRLSKSNRRRTNRKRTNRKRINRKRTNRRRTNRRRTNRRKIMMGGGHGEGRMGPTQYGVSVNPALQYMGMVVYPIATRIWDALVAKAAEEGGEITGGQEWVDHVEDTVQIAGEQGISGREFEGWWQDHEGL